MYLKNKKQRIFAGIILVLIIFILLIYLIPLPMALNKPLSKVIRYSNEKVMRVYLSSDEKWRIDLPIDNTDELFKKSTIMYEDKYFWLHPGINVIALLRAFYLNIKAGEIVSGGSTISMQLARLVEPKPRTVRSK
ncbi:transglycosylase domain-containing protein, partial [candidate division WOR-3 bacterium]|nr:transglycosylase domain-containing protein [candidate division WOR-3 bacterium]